MNISTHPTEYASISRKAERAPRQYAAAIQQIPTREGRREALQRVPVEWQALVRLHVELAAERKAVVVRENNLDPHA